MILVLVFFFLKVPNGFVWSWIFTLGQEHFGLWFETSQLAFSPQAQGDSHLKLAEQERCEAQSLSCSHSWRQPTRGEPLKPGRHVQTGTWFTTSHFVFWPHGLGLHAASVNVTFEQFILSTLFSTFNHIWYHI